MGEQHLNIAVESSFHQRLALVVLASVCMCSLLVWPPLHTIFLKFAFIATSLIIIIFFSYQLWLLNHWRCRIVLKADGSGHFADGQMFLLASRRWVTPLVCVFYIDIDIETDEVLMSRQLVILWSDMLAEKHYRHLCRILINS